MPYRLVLVGTGNTILYMGQLTKIRPSITQRLMEFKLLTKAKKYADKLRKVILVFAIL